MSKQLRLVESPKRPRSTKAKARRASTAKVPRTRRAHWAVDWRLDATTRQTGQAGVRAAREALARAQRPDADLRRAS